MTPQENLVQKITLPLLFPLNPINVYFISGEIPTLIDTGLDTDIAWERLVSSIEKLGFSIKDIKRVIVTHGHIDHFGHLGASGKIYDEARPEILIHPMDEYRATAGVEELVGKLDENARRFVAMGLSERDVNRIFRNYVKLMRRFYKPLLRYSFVEDGDKIEFGEFSLKVVETPGHTGGSISLFEEGSGGMLFSGDHIMNGVTTNPLPEMTADPGVGLLPYLDSMKKVQRLNPKVIYPGHGEVIEDPKRYIETTMAFHDDLSARIKNSLDGGWITSQDLTSRMFPELSGIYSSHVVFEVNSYLEAFCQRGEAELKEGEGEGVKFFRGV
jgi:glyoxylase-like metal-dependent hydrolase (beta-lactamase superfamily II)